MREFLERAKRSMVVEGNATEQLEGLIRQHVLHDVSHRLNRFDGRPISTEQVYQAVHLIFGDKVALTAAGAIASEEGGR